jgi:ABC-type sugar transport system ATPase subunit
MRDVVALADRVIIMGSGRKFVDRPMGDLTPDDLTHMIMSGNARAA